MAIHELSPEDVGWRLRVAREASGTTQAEAAGAIGLARTTLVAIEKGQRRLQADEARKLARIYGTSVNALLRKEAIHVDLVPRFRKEDTSTGDATDTAVQLLQNLVTAEIELENFLGVTRTVNYPPERPLLRGNVEVQAEADAIELRQWLGLGLSPTREMVTLLELDLGVRVYTRKLDAKVSGIFAYDDRIGACILLNAAHPPERRSQTAGHELAHLVSTRRTPEILQLDQPESSRQERYASVFARSFLTPTRTVMQKFEAVTAGTSQLTRRHVIVLAHAFGVSREAIVRRLEELGLSQPGTWDWFQTNGGITDEQARQVLGDLAVPNVETTDANRPTTLRINMLAAEAWHQGLLSEGQLANLLHLDRVELRELLDEMDIEGKAADGVPELSG